MSQTRKDRKDEARAGHRVNEARDAHERKDKRDEAAGGRKANAEREVHHSSSSLSHAKDERDWKAGGHKANESLRAERSGLSNARGVDEAGEGMKGVGGGAQANKGTQPSPTAGTGIGKIAPGHGPE